MSFCNRCFFKFSAVFQDVQTVERALLLFITVKTFKILVVDTAVLVGVIFVGTIFWVLT